MTYDDNDDEKKDPSLADDFIDGFKKGVDIAKEKEKKEEEDK